MAASHPLTGPFVGARPFDERDEALFFGRLDEAAELAGLWQRNRLTILHADPASGKTSLLRAGVIPRLRAERARVLPMGRVLGERVWPVAALPEHNPYVLGLLSSWAGLPPTAVAGLSVEDFLRKRQGFDRFGAPAPTLAVIDQAERFLRQSPADEHARLCFLDELFEAVAQRPDLHLLLSVRTDYLDDLLRVVKGYDGPAYTEFGLRPLSPKAAADVVRRSIQATGHPTDDDRIEELVEEVRTVRDDTGRVRERTDDVDPLLLQIAGRGLWGDPPDPRRFAEASLRDETDQALRDFCGARLAEIAEEHELPPARFAAWMRRAILLDPGARQAVPAPVTAAALYALEDDHLIAAPQHNGLRLHRPRHPRLMAPLRQLDPAFWPREPAGAAAHLRAAVRACQEGDTGRALRSTRKAADACPPTALRLRGDIETMFGNIAATSAATAHERTPPEQAPLEDAALRDTPPQDALEKAPLQDAPLEEAVAHYREAARIHEALGDNAAVGWLLTAIGRIALDRGRPAQAVEELRSAVGRVPGDPIVQTALGQALWQAGQPDAALAVLSDVLRREADTPEARRTRGEFLADLGDAESALRDIGRLRSRRAALPPARPARWRWPACRGPSRRAASWPRPWRTPRTTGRCCCGPPACTSSAATSTRRPNWPTGRSPRGIRRCPSTSGGRPGRSWRTVDRRHRDGGDHHRRGGHRGRALGRGLDHGDRAAEGPAGRQGRRRAARGGPGGEP
ncbi:tetratricopeptide repeat protein [Actinomadura sp. ATCC 31491]|uniref:Tetratricopeptide repeat protein n=1 Tax=Actinomadura luzonensis TaxID=2805427 RepID=A0ABT0G0Y9_9ACTN|nr:tetratricopeptide repeat protein [Actinomadura luzonensis]MCK2217845.1 tetratricopeptide repeat protein [Actinomadura luzonensis]